MITDGLNPLNLLTFLALVVGSGAAALLIFSLVLKRLIEHENSFFHGKTTFRLSV